LKNLNTYKEGKKMTLVELHDIMGDRIKITLRDDLSAEQRAIENEQTKIIVDVGKQMINNGKLILEYEKALAQTKTLEHSVLSTMIGE
jgi:hypothetical protein